VKKCLYLLIFIIFSLILINAQETDLFDWDLDSLFDESFFDIIVQDDSEDTVLSSIKRRGITFGFSYEFRGGASPGWDTAPWFFGDDDFVKSFSFRPGVKMNSAITVDAQISEVFRVLSVVKVSIPGSYFFTLGDFFFDYNLLNTVFIRAGKYEHSWGISPNFGFTNLLSRVPDLSYNGESYVFKADIPIGIGGFQAVALTRTNLLTDIPGWSDLGFGGKYNLAFRWADFDLGVFYQYDMATRAIFSIKTTLFDTEIYNEWLAAVNTHSDNSLSFAANVGFLKELFNRKIVLNAEFFYNKEGNTNSYQQESDITDAGVYSLNQGLNIALNLLYRYGGKGNPRFFANMLYAPAQNTMQLVPGFRLTPFQHVDVYMAVPMALGNKTGYYYENTADPFNRPFSIVTLITLKGGLQTSFN